MHPTDVEAFHLNPPTTANYNYSLLPTFKLQAICLFINVPLS